MSEAKVFIFHHEGAYLSGWTAVAAHTQEEALEMLLAKWSPLPGSKRSIYTADTLVIDPNQPQVVEISDGDY